MLYVTFHTKYGFCWLEWLLARVIVPKSLRGVIWDPKSFLIWSVLCSKLFTRRSCFNMSHHTIKSAFQEHNNAFKQCFLV